MKVGEKLSVRPKTFGKGHMEGKVIWIRPDHCFALVEFETEPKSLLWGQRPGKVRLRECFPLMRKGEKC